MSVPGIDQGTEPEKQESKKKRWSFARNRSSFATVLSQDSDSNEEWLDRPPHPFENASLLSKIFFVWPYELMKKRSTDADEAADGVLCEADLPDALPADSSAENLFKFNVLWMAEKRRAEEAMEKFKNIKGKKPHLPPKSAHPSLKRALIRDYLSSLWFLHPVMLVLSAAKLLQAVALGKLLQSFERSSALDNVASNSYLWAGLLVLSAGTVLLTNHQVYFFTWRQGMQLRVACLAAIFDKALRLKSTTTKSSGRVMNLATNDVERFLLASLFAPYMIWGVIMLAMILAVGWLIIGWSFAVGIAFMMLVIVPFQLKLSRKFGGLRSTVAQVTDSRVNAINQAIEGIRVVKLLGLENLFEERITAIRKKEIAAIQRVNWFKAGSEATFFVTNMVVSTLIFMVHVGSGGVLSIVNVYSTLALVNTAQFETCLVSRAVAGLSECSVSMRRIQAFLQSPDLKRSDHLKYRACQDPKSVVSVSNVTCHWNAMNVEENTAIDDSYDSTRQVVALDNVNLEFRAGEITCVIGEVGSGKSALLQMLIGELLPSSGTIVYTENSTVAYASQEPFLMSSSIRENILMGKEYDADLYQKVVEACSLKMDFEQMLDGEWTVVDGSKLSGGQKSRIGLARALYRDAGIIVLDDPLSAVDPKVCHHLFYSAILGLGVQRGKCVVLATHQHQFVGESRCILMSNGRVACVGSYETCVELSEGKLMTAIQNEECGDISTNQVSAPNNLTQESPTTLDELPSTTPGDLHEEHKEKTQTGAVKRDTFLKYMRAMPYGLSASFFMIMLCIVTQGTVLVTIAFMSHWSRLPAEQQYSVAIRGNMVGLVLLICFWATIRVRLLFFFTIGASQHVHDRMTNSVLRAQTEFFDTNNVGRIANRFSADIGSNDDLLPTTLAECFVFGFIVIGAITATVATLPMTLVICPPLIYSFLRVRRTFVNCSRELKRIEGLARSPIFTQIGEALNGIGTIRSNAALDYCTHKFRSSHDAHSKTFFAFLACSRWLGFWTDALMVIFLAIASFTAVIICDQKWMGMDSSILGIALTLLIQSAYVLQWTVRQSAEAVNQMVSVERCLEYCDLPQEAPLINEIDERISDWPSEGVIDISSLSVRYRPGLPLSLKDVTLRIEGGSRVGVVGRTGSGKSTLVQSFLRLIEAEEGQVLVDGVDTSKLGLHKLRHAISVIPQSPVLFGGCTIRENLDPFSTHDDEEVKKALLHANMLDTVLDQPQQLGSIVSDGGSNFSVGQRQLLCLARAILSKNKILVLDEASANVDTYTDELLQTSVKENFQGATIIAVAHRIDTIIGYDKILVMGNGKVLEYDSPYNLILKGGDFASMVRDTGDEMSKALIAKAKLFATKAQRRKGWICE